MSEDAFRLFTAVPLPHQLQTALSDWGAANKGDYPFQKWAHKKDLHITLFFMGETEPGRLPKIQSALRECAASYSPFRLSLGSIGTFGPPAAPSILWTGLEGNLERLKALQREVMHELVKLGFVQENKSYRPHITVARRYKGTIPWTQARDKIQAPFPLQGTEWTCNGFTLYRSHLGRSPMYEAIEEYLFPATVAAEVP